MPDVAHAIVHFSGRVQGVGFRYTTLQVAKEFEVTGYVQNLPDGRVLVEAQGLREELQAFITAVEERMHGYIRKTEPAFRLGPRAFTGFTIR